MALLHTMGTGVPCHDEHDRPRRPKGATSPMLGAAIDLLSTTRLDRMAHRISARIKWLAGNSAADVHRVVLEGEVLYDGPGVPPEAIDATDIARRIASAKHDGDSSRTPLLWVNNDDSAYPFIWDIWRRDPTPGGDLLMWSLCGDDAAHCALQIAALVGGLFWRSLADTSTNLRTGRATPSMCPAWLIDAALASDSRDNVATACDAAILCETLHALECEASTRGHAGLGGHSRLVVTTDSEVWRSQVGPIVRPPTRVTSTAVAIVSGFWVLGGTGAAAAGDGARLVTTRQAAGELARVRAMGTGARLAVAAGDHSHMINEPPVILSKTLRGASVSPGGASRRDALADIIAFADTFTRDCLGSVLAAVAASGIDGDGNDDGRCAHSRGGRASLGASSPAISITETICDLDCCLRAIDEAHLRAYLGVLWDSAPPQPMQIFGIGALGFTRADDGWWRDSCGRIVMWSDFVRDVRAAYVNVGCRGRDTSGGRPSRVAHTDPAHAPGLARTLCRDALAGDPRAADWLTILSVASHACKALAATVRNVAKWRESGCPVDIVGSTATAPSQARPLVDWVLDVPPHADLAARFEDMQNTSNAKLLDAIEAAGGRVLWPGSGAHETDPREILPCACPGGALSRWRDDPAGCRLCLCRALAYVHVTSTYDDYPDYHRLTCRGALIEALTCTPLDIDGRQILATETACRLVGDEARTIRALVRALYTVDPLRRLVIHRAQAAMVPVLTDAPS
ncbi:hypothetical protein pdul_cds_784 [Pandoravirus dulcis]|uniref:Uncharacterized protein n=1 Tax=Pandoravirus dulcis TaxID=1349409 RepID=A0A291AUF3_9VIRU|nr:hypothetical protein pdul_cds_784 [Pandoravirus dulcis]ATE82548.1 hypothetical protein pdul_cds_784 [Pandoravirus dulcis]